MKRKLWYVLLVFFVISLVSLPTALAAVGDAPQDYFSNEKKAELSVAYKLLYAPIWGGDVRQRVFYNGCDETIFGKYPPSEEMNQIWALLKTLPPKKVAAWGSSYYMRWAPVNGVWTVMEGDIPPGYLNGITRNNKTVPDAAPKALTTTALPKTPQPAAASQEPDLQTQINAIKAKLAKPMAATPAKPAAKPVAAAKKAPAVDASAKELATAKAELAACKDQAKKLGEEKANLESVKTGLEGEKANLTKASSDCQAGLDKANADLKAANANLAAAKTDCDIAVNNAKAQAMKDGLREGASGMFTFEAVIFWGIVGLLIGLIARPAIAFFRRRTTPPPATPRDGE